MVPPPGHDEYMEPDRTFEQPQLLPAPYRPQARPAAPASHSRQVGLRGIAQARAALALAARRAEERAHDKAA
jgi:hypothetical protein